MSGATNVEEIDLIPPRSTRGRLNVVLDLNGILCSCEPKWNARGYRNLDFSVHSATLPTEVGPKLVRVRPGCSDFLTKLSSFATITIWSSMMASTTSKICEYLFRPSATYPIRVLGQEDCDRVPLSRINNRIVYMKEPGTQKDIFLKTLSKHLFSRLGGEYTPDNTIVIDDSPIKHMLNMPENVLLLRTWSFKDEGADKDAYLKDELLPYLKNLYEFDGSLADYRSCYPEGRQMFYNDSTTARQYSDILNHALGRVELK